MKKLIYLNIALLCAANIAMADNAVYNKTSDGGATGVDIMVYAMDNSGEGFLIKPGQGVSLKVSGNSHYLVWKYKDAQHANEMYITGIIDRPREFHIRHNGNYIMNTWTIGGSIIDNDRSTGGRGDFATKIRI